MAMSFTKGDGIAKTDTAKLSRKIANDTGIQAVRGVGRILLDDIMRCIMLQYAVMYCDVT